MLKVIGGVPEGEYKAIASGSLPNGKPVIVNSDGTVSVVSSSTPTAGTPVAVTDTAGNKNAAAYDVASQKVVLAWYDAGNSDKGTAVVGTVSGETITFGSETVFEAGDTDDLYMIYEPNAQKVVIAYKDVGNSSYGTAIVGTVSGTSISFGTAVVFESAQSSEFSMSFDTAQNKVLIIYKDVGNNQYGTGVVGTVSGTSISFGTPVVFESSTTQQTTVSYDSNSGKHLVAYGETTSPNQGKIRLATISGTSVSYTAFTVLTNDNRPSWITSQPIGTGKVLVAFCYKGDSDSGQLACVSIDGSTMTVSDLVEFDTGDIVHIHSALNADTNEMIVVYSDENEAVNDHHGKFIVASVSGTTPTFTDPVTFESAYTERPAVAYDSNTKRAVVSYQDQGNSSFVTACVLNPVTSNVTADNFIGMSRGATLVVDTSVGSTNLFNAASTNNVNSVYDANAEKTVFFYTDEGNSSYGTAIVATSTGSTLSYGSEAVFEAANASQISCAYDSSNNKVVVAYRDNGNSNRGTACVGTVSGTSISFGTPVTFTTSQVGATAATFDSSNNKIVIHYRDNDNSAYPTAVVGTVSGTSISFGTPVVAESAATQYQGATFDSTNNKVILSYNPYTQNKGSAVVGTVSGTSISFGTPVNFWASGVEYPVVTFDSTNSKVVFAFGRAGTYTGTCVVGTVSGTTMTFGTAVVFDDSQTDAPMDITFDSNADKIVIAYKDKGNSNKGTYAIGTVSGTDITFEDPLVFSSGNQSWPRVSFDSSTNRVVTAYRDAANSDQGTGVILQVGYENRYPVADGDPARMDITGSVSTNQSGLTAGSKYYVQSDGTISTTSSSVLAGTAISATKLLVKT